MTTGSIERAPLSAESPPSRPTDGSRPSRLAWRPAWLVHRDVLARTHELSDAGVFLAVGLLALALLAFLGVIRTPVFVDEADNVMGSCLMWRGQLPYRDFFSHHFPTPYYGLAALGERGACSVLAARVFGVAVLTAVAGLFAWTARNPLAPLALLLVALTAPLYYAQLYLAETWVSAGLIASLALLTEPGRRLRGRVGFAVRALALLLLASSSPLGLMMVAILIPLVVLGAGRPYRPVLAACAASILIWPLVLLVLGSLPAFVDQGLLFNTQIYSKFLTVKLTNPLSLSWETLTFFRNRFSFVMDWLIGQQTKATSESFAVFFELALATAFVALALGRREDRLFRLGAILMLPLALSRDGFHLSPFVVLASFGCVQLLAPGIRRSGKLQLVAVVLVVLALRVYFFFLPERLDVSSELAKSMERDRQVQTNTKPADTVLYLPISPHGYLAENRWPGSFYTSFLPWEAAIPGAEDRIIADIERNKVAMIVLDQETAIWGTYRIREYAPRLYAHIMSAYRPIDGGDRRRARYFIRAAP